MPRNFFNFAPHASASDTTVLSIYDEIGFFGIDARSFEAKMQGIKTPKLDVCINSPGGNVYDGVAIYNMLKAFKGDVTVYIHGWAASIASIIAMAGKKVVMPENTYMFIHDPLFSYTSGDADELRQQADFLDKIAKGLVASYVSKTKQSEETVKGWMKGDTLFTAAEAKKVGLCDEVTGAYEASEADARWGGKIAAYYPTIPKLSAVGTQPPANTTTTKPENIMDPKDIKALQDRVSTLEASAQNHATELVNAKKAGATEAIAAEKKRREDIVAIQKKYNKDGDLDAITIEALNSDMDAAAYQGKVMDVMQARATTTSVRPPVGGAGGSAQTDKEKEIEKLRAEAANPSTTAARRGEIGERLRALRNGTETK